MEPAITAVNSSRPGTSGQPKEQRPRVCMLWITRRDWKRLDHIRLYRTNQKTYITSCFWKKLKNRLEGEKKSQKMITLNPVGGAMFLRSIGMFLQGGRRGSKPQAHSLIHQESRGKQAKSSGKTQSGLASSLFERLDEPEVFENGHLLSKRKSLKSKKKTKPAMSEEKINTSQLLNKLNPKMVDNLKKRTHFTREEIEALCKVYKKLLTSVANSTSKNVVSTVISPTEIPPAAARVEGLDRAIFHELIHNTFDLVTEEVLIDRIFCAFDRNNDGVIKLDNWIYGLSIFLRGTQEERTSFCFLVYDLNGDGYITREEMVHLLRNCLVKSPQDEDPEEGVRDLVELALKKLDIDKDSKISYQDFSEAVTEEPLLLEAFGQCLPAENACQTFISTLHC